MYVPNQNRLVGMVVGSQGSKIKELEQRHGLRINVQRPDEAGQSAQRSITLLGPAASAAECKRDIEGIVQQFEVFQQRETMREPLDRPGHGAQRGGGDANAHGSAPHSSAPAAAKRPAPHQPEDRGPGKRPSYGQAPPPQVGWRPSPKGAPALPPPFPGSAPGPAAALGPARVGPPSLPPRGPPANPAPTGAPPLPPRGGASAPQPEKKQTVDLTAAQDSQDQQDARAERKAAIVAATRPTIKAALDGGRINRKQYKKVAKAVVDVVMQREKSGAKLADAKLQMIALTYVEKEATSKIEAAVEASNKGKKEEEEKKRQRQNSSPPPPAVEEDSGSLKRIRIDQDLIQDKVATWMQ